MPKFLQKLVGCCPCGTLQGVSSPSHSKGNSAASASFHRLIEERARQLDSAPQPLLSEPSESPRKSLSEVVVEQAERFAVEVSVDGDAGESESTSASGSDGGAISSGDSSPRSSHSEASSPDSADGVLLPVTSLPSTPAKPRANWWSEAQPSSIKGLEDGIVISSLQEARVIKHAGNARESAPWLPANSSPHYVDMGFDGNGQSFVAVWLNVGDSSLLFGGRVVNKARLEKCLELEPLKRRIRLVLNPVRVRLPFPAKGPKDADTVGSFFGSGATIARSSMPGGGDVVSVQVDLFSRWVLKLALQKVGFQLGNVVELLLVDYESSSGESAAVLAACRLAVTDEYLRESA